MLGFPFFSWVKSHSQDGKGLTGLGLMVLAHHLVLSPHSLTEAPLSDVPACRSLGNTCWVSAQTVDSLDNWKFHCSLRKPLGTEMERFFQCGQRKSTTLPRASCQHWPALPHSLPPPQVQVWVQREVRYQSFLQRAYSFFFSCGCKSSCCCVCVCILW